MTAKEADEILRTSMPARQALDMIKMCKETVEVSLNRRKSGESKKSIRCKYCHVSVYWTWETLYHKKSCPVAEAERVSTALQSKAFNPETGLFEITLRSK